MCIPQMNCLRNLIKGYNRCGVKLLDLIDCQTKITIPFLCDDFKVNKVVHDIQKLKEDKPCGPDGISRVIIRILLDKRIHFILTLFNVIFSLCLIRYPLRLPVFS